MPANVACATIFTVCDWDWQDFAITETEAMPLADWIAQDTPIVPPVILRARGIDVSQWQGVIDWQAVKASGVEFAFIRATVGLRVDPYFAANWDGAGKAGILRGVYHYLEYDSDGQAAHFVSTVGDREPELGYWGDLEQAELTADKCQRFLEAVDRNLDERDAPVRVCDVYTRASFFDRFGAPDWVENRLLWVAHWSDVPEPTLPDAWSEWEFWQTTSDGTVPGIVGRVDLDRFNGDSVALHNLYGGESEENTYMDVKVFDAIGTEQSWDWLVAKYGNITIQKPAATAYFKVVELREKLDDSTFIVTVRNQDGTPKEGKGVLFYWPSAPPATGSGWLEQGVIGTTNANGDVGFGMGEGAYYQPALGETGPHKTWLFGENVSEMLEGIGMLWATNHYHVNAVYQYVVEEEPIPPPVPPPDDPLERIAAAAERCADALGSLAGDLADIRARWPFA